MLSQNAEPKSESWYSCTILLKYGEGFEKKKHDQIGAPATNKILTKKIFFRNQNIIIGVYAH
jgi:hypothetical protein